jgi:hypothetical protein
MRDNVVQIREILARRESDGWPVGAAEQRVPLDEDPPTSRRPPTTPANRIPTPTHPGGVITDTANANTSAIPIRVEIGMPSGRGLPPDTLPTTVKPSSAIPVPVPTVPDIGLPPTAPPMPIPVPQATLPEIGTAPTAPTLPAPVPIPTPIPVPVQRYEEAAAVRRIVAGVTDGVITVVRPQATVAPARPIVAPTTPGAAIPSKVDVTVRVEGTASPATQDAIQTRIVSDVADVVVARIKSDPVVRRAVKEAALR